MLAGGMVIWTLVLSFYFDETFLLWCRVHALSFNNGALWCKVCLSQYVTCSLEINILLLCTLIFLLIYLLILIYYLHMLCEFIPKHNNQIYKNHKCEWIFFWHFHSGNFLSFIPTFHAYVDILEVMYCDGNLLQSHGKFMEICWLKCVWILNEFGPRIFGFFCFSL